MLPWCLNHNLPWCFLPNQVSVKSDKMVWEMSFKEFQYDHHVGHFAYQNGNVFSKSVSACWANASHNFSSIQRNASGGGVDE